MKQPKPHNIPEPTKTIRIGDYDVPEPMRVAPEKGTLYYVVDIIGDCDSVCFRWLDDANDKFWLSRGLIHLTRETAKLHAKALISFTKQ